VMVIVGGIAGYVGPSIYIDRRIAARQARAPLRLSGFHGSLGGVRGFRTVDGSRARARPAANSATVILAVRQYPHNQSRDPRGRPLKDALERFADRLALDEAQAFATLINQSIDLAPASRCAAGL